MESSTIRLTGPWTKGSLSNTLQNVGCVMVAPNSAGGLSFRNSKAGDNGPVQHYDRGEIRALFAGLRDGEFGDFS